ncbi:MAG: hypothetical protein IJB10_00640 [Clostridia bacterium]|nr:hypothetical protein [Clostridia bacterium]
MAEISQERKVCRKEVDRLVKVGIYKSDKINKQVILKATLGKITELEKLVTRDTLQQLC